MQADQFTSFLNEGLMAVTGGLMAEGKRLGIAISDALVTRIRYGNLQTVPKQSNR